MKKYLLGAASLLVVAAAAIGGHSYYQEQQVDPMIRENIEALGQGESDPTKLTCYMVGTLGTATYFRQCHPSTTSSVIYTCVSTETYDKKYTSWKCLIGK